MIVATPGWLRASSVVGRVGERDCLFAAQVVAETALPKKNTSPTPASVPLVASAGSPVSDVASTSTSSQVSLIALSAQISSTRSAPPTPAPARTETLIGLGAVANVLGVLLLPILNVKSLKMLASEIEPCVPPPCRSIMMPLMPRE